MFSQSVNNHLYTKPKQQNTSTARLRMLQMFNKDTKNPLIKQILLPFESKTIWAIPTQHPI